MSENKDKLMPPSHYLWLIVLFPYLLFNALFLFVMKSNISLWIVIPLVNLVFVYLDARLCGEYDYYIGTGWVLLGLFIPVLYPFIRVTKTTKNYLPVCVQVLLFVLTILIMFQVIILFT